MNSKAQLKTFEEQSSEIQIRCDYIDVLCKLHVSSSIKMGSVD